MGKAERNRQQRARESIAQQMAATRRAEARRRTLAAVGSIVSVLAIVVVFIVVKSLNKPSAAAATGASSQVTTKVVREVTSVPAATLDKVAVGSVYPHAIQTITTASTPLTSGGKPEMVYVGAEYCPYCAAERWSLVIALSRFGAFSGLHFIHSSSTDVYPNTATLSFYQASFTSKYLVFVTTEAQTVTKKLLQPVTALDNQLMAKYDTPPYVPSAQYNGSFPFVDFGNKYVIAGASYSPALLAGLTWQQIGADLANPNSAVAKAIDGAANHITAAICKITSNQPASVCQSAGVSASSGSI